MAPVISRGLAACAGLALTLACCGCPQPRAPVYAEYSVIIDEPADEAVMLEDGFVRLQARVEATSELDVALDDLLRQTAVVFSSDVVGVLSREAGECSPWTDLEGDGADPSAQDDATSCWLVHPSEVGGDLVWSLVTRLPAGTHVIQARAVDTSGGRAEPASASTLVNVLPLSPPEIHLTSPGDGDELVTGSDFALEAWLSDDIDGSIVVAWSSSLHGVVHEHSTSAPGMYAVACHAGGVATEDDPCHLSTGTHVMVLSAVDEDGWTSHSFLTLHVVGPSADE